jgi:hypothetical protein
MQIQQAMATMDFNQILGDGQAIISDGYGDGWTRNN